MIADIFLAYYLGIAQQKTIEQKALDALNGCERNKKILESELTPKERGSIRYLYPIGVPDEAKQLFPLAEGLESITFFSEDSTFSTMFFKYKSSKNRWDIAIDYLTANGEPRGIYYVKGNLENVKLKDVENFIIKIVVPPDIYFGLRPNREDINNLDFNRLSNYIERAYYSCKDEIRLEFEVNFEKAKRIKPDKRKIKPNPDFHYGERIVPVKFRY